MPTPAYSGPDWTDAQSLIRELQNSSNGTVKVTLTVPADRYGGAIHIVAEHEYPQLKRRARPARDTCTEDWPNRKHKTFESAVFWTVFDLQTQFDARTQQIPLDL